MKISEEQKRENRDRIIEAAVESITERGIKGATMREIAKRAGLGDATIYNYFSTKEAIVYAYYESRLAACSDRLGAIEGFGEFSLRERLQTFFETQLELFLPDREFLEASFKTVTFSMTHDYEYLKPVRTFFFRLIREFFEAAVASGEIPQQPFLELTCQFIWDFYVGLVLYWLRDRSERFENTTVLIDKSVDLGVAFVGANMINKILDVTSFLFRNHIVNRLDWMSDRMDAVRQAGRAFMEMQDGRRNTQR